eukprot:TRINITY_DN34604_c0_g1_i1.p1 TRINITY_DN34604_c0_g1~~TRINITY_DN34604_c0_g1_i1.p1  ORF type:complete len:390 (-),score=43.86 TRINITY_DN34604_c0_g1_i1:194-1363(-)
MAYNSEPILSSAMAAADDQWAHDRCYPGSSPSGSSMDGRTFLSHSLGLSTKEWPPRDPRLVKDMPALWRHPLQASRSPQQLPEHWQPQRVSTGDVLDGSTFSDSELSWLLDGMLCNPHPDGNTRMPGRYGPSARSPGYGPPPGLQKQPVFDSFPKTSPQLSAELGIIDKIPQLCNDELESLGSDHHWARQRQVGGVRNNGRLVPMSNAPPPQQLPPPTVLDGSSRFAAQQEQQPQPHRSMNRMSPQETLEFLSTLRRGDALMHMDDLVDCELMHYVLMDIAKLLCRVPTRTLLFSEMGGKMSATSRQFFRVGKLRAVQLLRCFPYDFQILGEGATLRVVWMHQYPKDSFYYQPVCHEKPSAGSFPDAPRSAWQGSAQEAVPADGTRYHF